MNKTYLKSIVVLTAICLVMAAMLATVNYITEPIIKAAEDAAAEEALLVVMPNGKNFKKIDISSYTLPSTVTEVYSEDGGGYVVRLTTTGYSSGLVILCGVDAKGSVTGTAVLASSETLGEEYKYGVQVVGATSETIDSLDTVAGATKTTAAYKSAVKDALNTAIIIGGGDVDLRDEDEKLADALTEVLPAGEGKFAEWFATELLEGVSAVYAAENGAGYVLVINDRSVIDGEAYVGVDAEGKVVSSAVPAALAEWAERAAAVMLASKLTDIDLSGIEGISERVVSVKRTESQNLILEVEGAGYGINGGSQYRPASGKYILIRISLTKDGKIIACKTLSEEETDGFGSACSDRKFYSQFSGKNESNYKEIDAISGATVTTNGYLGAVGLAFDTLEILNTEGALD